ncbi:MAG: DUF4058 family protein [Chloroflexi bacterium]|nr:DUF4058 family protein [Chloroflexota bacterium]
MPSPFPGMDPYLEDPVRWPDVHQSLITYIRDALQPQVRPTYLARIGERVYVITPPHAMYPDVLLVQKQLRESVPAYAATAMPTQAESLPIVMTLPPIEHREPFVEIVHAAGEQVITVIEGLSPANKMPGEGHDQYRQKQQQILASHVHLVEIDLLASGQATVAIPPKVLATLAPYRYMMSVRRATERYRYEMYPIPLARPLPKMRVPLRAPDADVELDLQSLFTRGYDNGGYDDIVDYQQPPRAPLSADESAWVDGWLKSKRKR